MLFSPPGADRVLWDSWLVEKDRTFHLFHLQKKPGRRSDAINHATSNDLIHWQDQGPILRTGDAGHWDAGPLLTGTVVEHHGLYYLFYGARTGGWQVLGAARSRDLYHWDKWNDGPLLKPDPRWYEVDIRGSLISSPAWRDPCVVQDDSGQFHMFLSARAKQGPFSGRGCIAHAVSADLRQWTINPPVFTSKRFGFLEVPDIFKIGSAWYLIYSAAEWHSCRGKDWSYAASGIRYLVSPAVTGPFTEPEDDLLLGSPPGSLHNYVGRTLGRDSLPADQRLFYYHNVYPNQSRDFRRLQGSWAQPKVVAAAEGRLTVEDYPEVRTRLSAAWDPLICGQQNWVGFPVPGSGRGQWTWYADDRLQGTVNGGSSAHFTEQAVSGLELRFSAAGANRSAGALVHFSSVDNLGTAVLFAPADREIQIANCSQGEFGWLFEPILRRPLPPDIAAAGAVKDGGTLQWCLVAAGRFLDVYVHGRLLASLPMPQSSGFWGFLAEDGQAHFRDIHALQTTDHFPGSNASPKQEVLEIPDINRV